MSVEHRQHRRAVVRVKVEIQTILHRWHVVPLDSELELHRIEGTLRDRVLSWLVGLVSIESQFISLLAYDTMGVMTAKRLYMNS